MLAVEKVTILLENQNIGVCEIPFLKIKTVKRRLIWPSGIL